MITTRIFGGLGNQMFQYAAGKALALRAGQTLRLDTHWFLHISKNLTHRDYELSIYKNISAPTGNYLNFFQRNHFDRTHRFISEHIFDYETTFFNLCYEGNKNWSDAFLTPENKNYNLNGYWQSEDYFKDCKDQIKHDFMFPELDDIRDLKFLQETKMSTVVSLHVRRGDYISLDGSQTLLGNVCTKEYYQSAIKLIQSKIDDFRFAVFSDEVNWVKENLSLPDNTLFIDWHTGKNSFRDMQLMSLCDHHIIANSSFSWWGAWLGQNENKIVIAPNRWLNAEDPLNSTRCPELWIRI